MPEFQLDCGSKHVQYRALDEFTRGYIEAALIAAAKAGECDLYLGDDGGLYI